MLSSSPIPMISFLIVQQEKQTAGNNNNIKLYCNDQKLFKSGTKKFMEK